MYFSPRRVRAGSKVALVAPSATFSTQELAAGLDVIREAGLEPVAGPCVKNLRTTSPQRAASPIERAEELNWAFMNPNISAVFAVRGGEGSAAVLPHLNYEAIKKAQKPFIGKSDNTSISMALLTKSKLVSICGRGAAVRCDAGHEIQEADYQSLKLTVDLLMSDQPWNDRPLTHNQHFSRTVSSGFASGYAIGGNSDTFSRLIGTDYLPQIDGAILFLEDVDETATTLSKMFLHMKLAGVLNRVNGIVLGEFVSSDLSAKKNFSYEGVIREYFEEGPPCAYGYSFSHGKYTCPIPMGAKVELNADTGEMIFDFKMSSANKNL
jgi:muramoyltetrapeptide carboxypeptidase